MDRIGLESLWREQSGAPHSLSTELTGPGGTEGQNLLFAQDAATIRSWRRGAATAP